MIFLGITKLKPGPRTSLYAIDQMVTKDRQSINDDMVELFGMLASGAIRPLVGARIRLADAVRAHEQLESKAVTGKLVFNMP